MTVDSLRDYLQTLDEKNDLIEVKDRISWNLEASALTMLANERDHGIPLFEDVDGRRLVGDPYRGSQRRPWDRIAQGIDLPQDISRQEFYRETISRLQNPREPVTISPEDAPCKEVTRVETDVDLLEFPWPYIHAGDGGRYSNLHTLIVSDPDSAWIDWSYHRAMIHDNETASVLLLAGEQTPNLFYYKYEREDEPMPVAIAVGTEPAVQYTSVMWIPTGRSEAAFAGGLKGSPIELVPCETNDLLVPATAELIIEGEIVPNIRRDEGPFGDYFGYMHGPRRSMPTLRVTGITHRKRPIIPFCVEGTGVGYTENSTSSMEVGCVGPDATLGLQAGGFDIDQCVPWSSTPRGVYVISTGNTDPGYLHELANFIFTTWGMLHVDFFVFVDADIDPFDQREVLEALVLHADPDSDFHQFGVETMPKVPLNIYQTPSEKGNVQTGTSKAKTAKAYIDATRSDDDFVTGTLDDDLQNWARSVLEDAGANPDMLPFTDSAQRGGSR
ncbi:3-octaprenyl-4-hydroxybenzoate carboxy-lyase [Halalkalicoccus paucihalophilus]|uniref:3-octaprenyl-4-hydroxybenzoate carboxy-lyase n=1 Tax=Halalkalicoccus paucihalophilus TaxID=1008153 RepID=A0A151A858_9EURY|nr:UbiD family decarboxylase [Halalkalicoccus paucihalophilus]KYH23825.1 3-octaprenyl-4-hydroxybenzoate carboxy-lyase [Halalkalicoccus paucihalophilus]